MSRARVGTHRLSGYHNTQMLMSTAEEVLLQPEIR